MRKHRVAFFTGIHALILTSMLFAQVADTSDAATRNDSLKTELRQQEIILQEILIEGEVEKPNVTILPARKETEFGEIDFINRSFATELRALPDRSHLFGEWLHTPVLHNKLKTLLARDKKDFIRDY